MFPNPMVPHRQLALTIYRMTHGCSFKVIKYIFGVSQSLATQTFNKVIRVLISSLYDEFIKLPSSEEDRVQECKSFIENYEFPCVGAWGGFHVNITHLKNHYSFKNKYTVSSMSLVGHNKRFLHLTTGAPGSTRDARLLRHCSLFRTICNGGGILNKTVSLENGLGTLPRVRYRLSALGIVSFLD